MDSFWLSRKPPNRKRNQRLLVTGRRPGYSRVMTRASWLIAVGICLVLPTHALAKGEPPTMGEAKKEVKERKEALKDKLKERKEEIKERKEEAKDQRDDAKDQAKDAATRLREQWQRLRDTRKDRRQERRERIQKRWGEIEKKPAVRAELKVHAWRMARLKRLRAIAEAEGNKDKVARIDKLTQKETERHDKHMETLQKKGGVE
jgi:hypothetical protein